MRVVLTGAESTGKTTLARVLATYFRAPLVPEYARLFVEAHARAVVAADVEAIARGAMRLWDEAPAAPLLLFDTDLLSTCVYARSYFGACPAWIDRAAEARRPDLYLHLQPDIPWQPDGPQRGDAAARLAQHEAFAAALAATDVPVVPIAGPNRLGDAVAAVGRWVGG